MRQLIPALLLLTLLLPAAAAAQSPVTRAQFVAALWTCSGAVPYDANGPFSDVNPNSPGATAVAWAYDLGSCGAPAAHFLSLTAPSPARRPPSCSAATPSTWGGTPFCPAEWPPVTTLRGSLPGRTTPSTGPPASACWRGARTAGRSPRAPSPRRSWSRPSPVFLIALSRLFPIFWSTGEPPFKQKMPGTAWFQAFLRDRQASPAPSSPAPPRWAPASQCLPRWQSVPP